jgi:hypothetical protein
MARFARQFSAEIQLSAVTAHHELLISRYQGA